MNNCKTCVYNEPEGSDNINRNSDRTVITKNNKCINQYHTSEDNYWYTDDAPKNKLQSVFCQCDNDIIDKYKTIDKTSCLQTLSSMWKKAIKTLNNEKLKGGGQLYDEFKTRVDEFIVNSDDSITDTADNDAYNNLLKLAAYEMCRQTNEKFGNQRKFTSNIFMESSFMNIMSYIVVSVIFSKLFIDLFFNFNAPNQTFIDNVFGSISSSSNARHSIPSLILLMFVIPSLLIFISVLNNKYDEETIQTAYKFVSIILIFILLATFAGILVLMFFKLFNKIGSDNIFRKMLIVLISFLLGATIIGIPLLLYLYATDNPTITSFIDSLSGNISFRM